jgi:hypothetical protein
MNYETLSQDKPRVAAALEQELERRRAEQAAKTSNGKKKERRQEIND